MSSGVCCLSTFDKLLHKYKIVQLTELISFVGSKCTTSIMKVLHNTRAMTKANDELLTITEVNAKPSGSYISSRSNQVSSVRLIFIGHKKQSKVYTSIKVMINGVMITLH